MNTLFDLTGRKAIVTGAAQGLAYSMAEGLMESGAEVAVIDISDRTVEVAREFCGRGFRCHGIQADLSRIDELEGVFSRAVDALGGLDIIVNGAGVQLSLIHIYSQGRGSGAFGAAGLRQNGDRQGHFRGRFEL